MFPYPGGKSKISKWLIPFFPECSTYSEPFSGAFWTYVKWKELPTTVVYNDLNLQLANVFECIRTDPSRVADMMETLPSEDVDTFTQIRDDVFNNLGGMNPQINCPDFDLALKFIYLQTHHFIGHQITATLRYQHIDTERWSSRYGALVRKLRNPKYVQRLHSITNVESMDFQEVIEKYDSPDAFFYVDPPYWNTEHYYTQGQFNEDDHKRLKDILHNIQGKFALSYYEFAELNEWYPQSTYNWQFKEFTSPMSAGANSARKQEGHGNKVDTSKHKATELLIMNYDVSTHETLVNDLLEF